MAGMTFKLEVKGLNEALNPLLTRFVGTDRITRMRKGLSKAANRMKYYIRKEFQKHMRSGLLAGNISYRVKYYRNTDTLVAVVGVRSKKEFTYKGRNQITHKYAGFLVEGRKEANQLLRQPPFARRTTNRNAPKIYPRHVGAQPGFIYMQGILDRNREVIIQAAIAGAKAVVE